MRFRSGWAVLKVDGRALRALRATRREFIVVFDGCAVRQWLRMSQRVLSTALREVPKHRGTFRWVCPRDEVEIIEMKGTKIHAKFLSFTLYLYLASRTIARDLAHRDHYRHPPLCAVDFSAQHVVQSRSFCRAHESPH